MQTLLLLVGWCILFVLCWPLALLALIAWPIVWLLSIALGVLAGAVNLPVRESAIERPAAQTA